jgi:hypothetical protein
MLYAVALLLAQILLKGAGPVDLSAEQPSEFDMFIDGKTANFRGLWHLRA